MCGLPPSSKRVNDRVPAVVSQPARRTATSWSRRTRESRVKRAREEEGPFCGEFLVEFGGGEGEGVGDVGLDEFVHDLELVAELLARKNEVEGAASISLE